MKKIIRLLLCFILMNLFIIPCVSMANSDDDVSFDNFVYVSTKTRKNNKIKVFYKCSWTTNVAISVENVIYEIKSQEGNLSVMNKGVCQEHRYDFIVEDWQTGTLKLTIEYRKADEDGIPDLTGKVYTKTFYLAENSKWKDEVNWPEAILFGLFTTICVISATMMIIANSKKEYINQKEDEE